MQKNSGVEQLPLFCTGTPVFGARARYDASCCAPAFVQRVFLYVFGLNILFQAFSDFRNSICKQSAGTPTNRGSGTRKVIQNHNNMVYVPAKVASNILTKWNLISESF